MIKQKRNNKQSIRIIFFWLLIPGILLGFWIICSLLFANLTSFSVLDYNQQSTILQAPSGQLLKGEKIFGEFTALDNYLGIVRLRFNDYVKHDFLSEDVLSFRIKEKGAKDWYYYNNYRSGLLEHQLLFPFGFPVITFSKGKTYQFQIESLFGNPSNAVEFNRHNTSIVTSYQPTRKEIFGSKFRIISFLFKKTLVSFTNGDFLLRSITFLVPFIAYVLWMFFLKKSKVFRQVLSLSVVFLILVDVFLLKEVYGGIIAALCVAWIISIIVYKFESTISFLFASLFLVIWLLLLTFHINIFSNKLNIWVYFFLVIGAAQSIWELKYNPKGLIGYQELLKRLKIKRS